VSRRHEHLCFAAETSEPKLQPELPGLRVNSRD
jgi:hypothetical protein